MLLQFMFKIIISIAIVCSLANSNFTMAQIVVKDTLRVNKPKWEFDFLLDQRKSIFLNKNLLGDNVSTNVNGINVGYTKNKLLRFGIGAYFSKASSSKPLFISKTYYVDKVKELSPRAILVTVNGQQGYFANSKLTLFYFTPSVEYIFYNSKWLSASVPLEFGMGYSKVDLTDFFDNAPIPIVNSKGKVFNIRNYFFPLLVGLNARINLSPDVAFTSSVGYRKIVKEIGISQNFDGIYYQLGFRLLPKHIKNELKRDIKKWF
jgi:hypothetical protein